MPVPSSDSVSFEMLARPVPARCAPAAFTELAQPLPAAPALPHGQAVPVPSPKQYVVKDGGGGGVWSTICTPLNVAKLETTVSVITMLPPAGTVTLFTACVMPAT